MSLRVYTATSLMAVHRDLSVDRLFEVVFEYAVIWNDDEIVVLWYLLRIVITQLDNAISLR